MVNKRNNWSRDEILLAVDLLLNSEDKSFSMDDERIAELSNLLQEMPIVPKEMRSEKFRNIAGVRRQILTLYWGLNKNKSDSRINRDFYNVYREFENDRKGINDIAKAIRRCLPFAKGICFANKSEIDGFKEGALLGHLHRYFEKNSEGLLMSLDACYICTLKVDDIYNYQTEGFIELHLLISPINYKENMSFHITDFVGVCPNCHRMLHLIRPWTTKNNIKNILKTY